MKETIKIDIVSDIACPWCYVGKKHIENAIEQVDEFDIKVEWKPFQLDPSIPEKGLTRETYLSNKFGSLENVQGMLDRLVVVGEKVGITFNWMKNVPNTLRLHLLLHQANEEGFANDLKESLFRAYFTDVIDLTNDEEIFKITASFGWTSEKTKSIMEDQELASVIANEIKAVQQRGVSSVPYFIINDKYGVSGAQPPEILAKWIRNIGAEIKSENINACAVNDPDC